MKIIGMNIVMITGHAKQDFLKTNIGVTGSEALALIDKMNRLAQQLVEMKSMAKIDQQGQAGIIGELTAITSKLDIRIALKLYSR